MTLVVVTLSLQISRRLVNVIYFGAMVSRAWWISCNDIPRVDEAREVSENTKQDVKPCVSRTTTAADPHCKRREKNQKNNKAKVSHEITATHFDLVLFSSCVML